MSIMFLSISVGLMLAMGQRFIYRLSPVSTFRHFVLFTSVTGITCFFVLPKQLNTNLLSALALLLAVVFAVLRKVIGSVAKP